MTITDLPLFAERQPVNTIEPDVNWLLSLWEYSTDWITGREIAERAGWPWNETTRRKIRGLVHDTDGRVIGNQQGYKPVSHMTPAEYNHWRNRRLKESDEAKADVIAADKRFYQRARRN